MDRTDLLFFYHPTTMACIDDNRKYLHNLDVVIRSMNFLCKTFDNPARALDYFNKEYILKELNFGQKNDGESIFHETTLNSIDINSIHKRIHDGNRFNHISVIIVDYAMPGMSGLEFCEMLKAMHPNIKTILLTGEADEKLAVTGFNKGIIDKFIRKDEKHFILLLEESIQEMQYKYFQSYSNIIVSMLRYSIEVEIPFYKDKTFIEFFKNLLTQHNIVEYYLLDNSGSYLLLDDNKNANFFIVKSESEMQSFYEIAENGNASENIIQKLKTKEALPYFHSEQDLDTPPSNWEKYLHPAKILFGKQKYYFSYFNDAKK